MSRRRAPGARGKRSAAAGLALALALAGGAAAGTVELGARTDGAALTGAPLRLEVTLAGLAEGEQRAVRILADGETLATESLGNGTHTVHVPHRLAAGHHALEVAAAGAPGGEKLDARFLPGWLSVAPPLIAILLALVFKDVLLSLFCGIFFGALILYGWDPLTAFGRSIDTFIAPSLADRSHASILIFSTLLGGMVGIIGRSGGTQGIVERLAGFATNARRGQLATWILGVLIFFDDYANTLIVGSTMRPITDRLRVSREKLAYIVDSTAAPVASVVPISTWIGFEVGLIAAAMAQLELPYSAYPVFIASIPYRFYPLLALVFGFTIAFSCRDFGPMLKAELRASRTGQLVAAGDTPLADYEGDRLSPPPEAPKRAVNAYLPVLTVIGITLAGLFITGAAATDRGTAGSTGAWLREVFANSDSYAALLWASLAGVVVAFVLAVSQRILNVRHAGEAMIGGFKSMLLALVVLLLAWSLGEVCESLRTADYLVELTRGVLSPHWLPVLVFLLSAATAFATGSSWGAMGILMPLVIPIAHGLSLDAGNAVGSEAFYVVLLGTISSVLAGSVWGDHCSPISDTTILSSMASGCDHIAHVRTQMPYALGVGVLAMLVGDIPTAYGLSPWISLVVGAVVLVALVFWRGRPSAWDGSAREAAS